MTFPFDIPALTGLATGDGDNDRPTAQYYLLLKTTVGCKRLLSKKCFLAPAVR